MASDAETEQPRNRRERRAGILPAGEGGHDAQVTRGRDGQELGEPLHDPEDRGLEPAHASVVSRR